MKGSSSKEIETQLFMTRSSRIVEIVGTQFYVFDTDLYYEITRADCVDGIYILYGVQIDISELSDEPVDE